MWAVNHTDDKNFNWFQISFPIPASIPGQNGRAALPWQWLRLGNLDSVAVIAALQGQPFPQTKRSNATLSGELRIAPAMNLC
jgi:hypothetical protein